MCRTSAPPRRDLYELEQTLSAEKQESAANGAEPTGSFLLPGTRLSVRGWNSGRRTIYNANYSLSGEKWLDLDRPWTVISPIDFRTFHTNAEAYAYAFKGMTK